MDITKINEKIKRFEDLISTQKKNPHMGKLYTGVDLGTASIVLCVVDEENNVIAGAFERCNVVRDGIIVDFVKAVAIVRKLKEQLEKVVGESLDFAAGAIPPGVSEGSSKIVRNVLETVGFQALKIVDEPTAASELLGITEGAVVDIGGGTTGISILKGGEVTKTYDEATGGHHMNLVISGSYNLPYDEAEKLKCSSENEREVYQVVLPVIEKMASIVKKFLDGESVDQVYLVGGGSTLKGFEKYFESTLGINTIKPYNPMLVTPMGIALSVCKGE